jgi:chlorobactene glucosyltransferase
VLLAAAIAFDLVLAWMIARMVRQARAYTGVGPAETGAVRDWPRVAVIVPARDEADVVRACIAGLLAQDYPAERLSICLVDDGSRDGTSAIALAAAGGDRRFRLVRGAALPEGWTGKSFACHQGAARALAADYLCFMDADTVAEPGLIRAGVAHAQDHGTHMLSLEPFQVLAGALERLIIPCGLYLVAASQDMRRINSPHDSTAAANGQFILIRRDAYDAVGGHAAVRGEICEDSALAGRVKRAGLRFALHGAEGLVRARMYRDGRSLWTGLSKNATVLGGGPVRTVLIAGAGFLFVAAALVLAALCGIGLADGASIDTVAPVAVLLCGLLAMIGLHLAGTRHFRIPPLYGLLFPIGYALTFALALDSARLAFLGRVRWKGRTYRRLRAGSARREAAKGARGDAAA